MNHKYLVITEKFPPKKGGSNTIFHEVYSRIGDRDTHIVTCRQPGALSFDLKHPNTVHRLELERSPWVKPESLGIYIKLLLKSLAIGIKHDFHEIRAGRVLSEGLVGFALSKILKKKLVIYAHGEEITTWTQPLKFKFMKLTYKQADRIIANSHFTRTKLTDLGILSSRVEVVHPGVDLGSFRPGLFFDDLLEREGIKPGQKLIISVGRLSRRKGFDHVIRSLPHLLEAGLDVVYALVGIGEDREYLVRLAAESGVAGRVHMLGHVPDEDLPRWLNAAKVFAMPNREVDGDVEGFGIVYIEAAACGKPSVSGISGGTGNAVVHGETGLRVDGSSISEITAALAKILSNPDFANKLGKQGRKRALKDFSWTASALKHR